VTRAYLALGSLLGERATHLQHAVDGIAGAPGVEVVAVSRVYETTPVGGPPQPDYLNAVIAVETHLSPRELLALAQSLEAAAERVRGERFGPRSLDVDVLLVGDAQVAEPDLVVPHPRLRERRFVLVPLADVAPDSVVEPQDPGPDVRLTAVALTHTSGPPRAGT
jgi:2-amino-4-hydroxy-6-hydroxymethyldihydropteridine diphosphokinase